MYTSEETLTPKQLYVCASILVLVFLAFCSVFVYAYWKGAQVRMSQAQSQTIREQQFEDLDLNKKHIRIARGQRGQALNIQFQEQEQNLDDASPCWTISQIPPVVEEGPQPAAPIIAFSASPGSWHVYPTGIVQVPQNAGLGLYKLQYPAGDYMFEVVANKSKSTQVVHSTPPHKASGAVRLAQLHSRPLHYKVTD